MPRVGGDVAEHVLHLAAEAEPNGNGVDLIDRFGSIGRFLKNDFTESECEVGNRPVVGFQEAQQLWMGRAAHYRSIYTEKGRRQPERLSISACQGALVE